MYLARKTVAFVLLIVVAVSASGRQLSQAGTGSPNLSDLGSQIQEQVSQQINQAKADMFEKCGPNAGSISNDMCFASCKGSLTIDNSDCTCNGKPCVSWKVGESGPTDVVSNVPSEVSGVSTQSSAEAPSLACITAALCFLAIVARGY